MAEFEMDEERLNRLNTFLARADDVIIYNCITRTAQESKLFPLMPYLMLCFYDAYYRFPDLIRDASRHITPEQVGHRVRESSMLPSKLSAWGTLNFYLNGRASLIKLGLLRPEDNLEDLVTVVDWWERFSRSYHRNSGHAWTYDRGTSPPSCPSACSRSSRLTPSRPTTACARRRASSWPPVRSTCSSPTARAG